MNVKYICDYSLPNGNIERRVSALSRENKGNSFMITEKKNTTSRVFTTMLILYPLLSLYSLFGTSVMLPDFLMILFLVFIVAKAFFTRSISLEISFLPWTVYIVLHMLATLLFRDISDSYDFMGSTFRYLLYFILILFGVRDYFDVEYGIKVYKYVCIVSTAFLILQTVVVALFGYYIKGYLEISFLPIGRTDLIDFGKNVSQYTIFRPRSFFSEPAHYGTYICGYFTISLFKNGKKELPVQLFLSLGALLSMSSTAILMIVAIWMIYFAVNFSRRISYRTMLIVLCIPFILFFVVRTDYFQNFIYRFFETNSTKNRLNGYENIMQYFSGNIFLFLFGYGIGGLQYGDFLAGYGKLFISYGLLGTMTLTVNLISVVLKKEKWQKMLFVAMLILQIGGDSLFNNIILCQLPFICSGQNKMAQGQESQYIISKVRYNL